MMDCQFDPPLAEHEGGRRPPSRREGSRQAGWLGSAAAFTVLLGCSEGHENRALGRAVARVEVRRAHIQRSSSPPRTFGTHSVRIRCPGHRYLCGLQCADLATDTQNCGGCGQRCDSGEICHMARCVRRDIGSRLAHGRLDRRGRVQLANPCSDGTTRCGDDCFTLNSNARNCGACGYACGTGERCLQGRCVSALAWRVGVGMGGR